MQNFRKKTNQRYLRYLKTGGPTEGQADRGKDGQTDEQGRLLWTPLGKPGLQYEEIFYLLSINNSLVLWFTC